MGWWAAAEILLPPARARPSRGLLAGRGRICGQPAHWVGRPESTRHAAPARARCGGRAAAAAGITEPAALARRARTAARPICLPCCAAQTKRVAL